MNVQEVLAKVAKLRRLATSDNIHEATRAAQMADLLLQKYRLEECSLPEDQQEQIQESAEPFEQCRKFTGWKRMLRNVLTNHYGCTHYSRQDGKDYLVYLVGLPSDLEQFKYMYAWLVVEINKHNICMGKASRTSFAEGCVYGFAKALADSKEKAMRDWWEAHHPNAEMRAKYAAMGMPPSFAPDHTKNPPPNWPPGICGTCDGNGCPVCRPEPAPPDHTIPEPSRMGLGIMCPECGAPAGEYCYPSCGVV